jgi:SAM-dependent methyltransferase
MQLLLSVMADNSPLESFDHYKENLSSIPLIWNGRQCPHPVDERHYRILCCLLQYGIKGPTLDVASGNAVFYPSILTYKPEMLPYAVTDIVEQDILYDGTKITCHKFECEKTLLPLEDNSVGCILFCDVIEHLIVDPVWAILEFNRVLRPGGHIVISTPNACHIKRIIQIYKGHNSATENHIKPTSIYQRHNREWSINEIYTLLKGCGFNNAAYSTYPFLLNDVEKAVFDFGIKAGLATVTEKDIGPEIFYIAEKAEHMTLKSVTNIEQRWPEWLYTHIANYRRRPAVFPIVLGEDYG